MRYSKSSIFLFINISSFHCFMEQILLSKSHLPVPKKLVAISIFSSLLKYVLLFSISIILYSHASCVLKIISITLFPISFVLAFTVKIPCASDKFAITLSSIFFIVSFSLAHFLKSTRSDKKQGGDFVLPCFF